MKPSVKKVIAKGVIGSTIIGAGSAAAGALSIGTTGAIGKYALSFFDPTLSSGIASFGTFAAMGAIAAPLAVFPKMLLNHFINKSEFLNNHPHLQSILKDSCSVLLTLGGLTSAALMLGLPPLGISVLTAMIIPTALFVCKTILNVIKMCIDAVKASKNTNPEPDEGYPESPYCYN